MAQVTQENITVNILSWQDSPAVKRLLDVVCSILAEEYIAVAKQNPRVFIIPLPIPPHRVGGNQENFFHKEEGIKRDYPT